MDECSVAAIEELEKCDMIDLLTYERVGSWGLRVRVQEMVPRGRPENPERDFVPELAALLRNAIRLAPKGRVFELTWQPECISYYVQNESYGKYPEPPEIFTGRMFRRFSWSYLLELTKKTCYASADWPGLGPLQHFSIPCCNDIVDVVACAEPTVRQITEG